MGRIQKLNKICLAILVVGSLSLVYLVVKFFSPPEKVDYVHLENLLKSEEWEQADAETSKILRLKASERNLFQIYLGGVSIFEWESFPCNDLLTIDQLWLKYSNSYFGFSIQQAIWGKPELTSDAVILDNLDRFNQSVGWNQEKPYDFDLSAPKGRLPSSRWIAESTPKIDGMYGYKLNSFFLRTHQCYSGLESSKQD